jgi:hypothetical protein
MADMSSNRDIVLHGNLPAFSSQNISNDGVDLAGGITRGIYVGGGGTLVIRDAQSNATVTFSGVVTGTTLPIGARAIGTGTTATLLVALR